MSNVVDLGRARAERGPHTSGPCVCLSCGEKWVGVVPAGVTDVECPKCGLVTGIRAGLGVWMDEPHFTCGCGNQYLHIVQDGAYCPVCALGYSWGELQG